MSKKRIETHYVRDTKRDVVNSKDEKIKEVRLSEGNVYIDDVEVELYHTETGNRMSIWFNDEPNPDNSNQISAVNQCYYPSVNDGNKVRLKTSGNFFGYFEGEPTVFDVQAFEDNQVYKVPIKATGNNIKVTSVQGNIESTYILNNYTDVDNYTILPLNAYEYRFRIEPLQSNGFDFNASDYGETRDFRGQIKRLISWGNNEFTTLQGFFTGSTQQNLLSIPDGQLDSDTNTYRNLEVPKIYNNGLISASVMFVEQKYFNGYLNDCLPWTNFTDVASMLRGCNSFDNYGLPLVVDLINCTSASQFIRGTYLKELEILNGHNISSVLGENFSRNSQLQKLKIHGLKVDISFNLTNTFVDGKNIKEAIESFDPDANATCSLSFNQRNNLEAYLQSVQGGSYTDIQDWLDTNNINWTIA